MHIRGSSSWRFEHDDLDILDHALFMRDAARLAVPESAEVPPSLVGSVTASSVDLSPAEQAVAAGDWLTWWRLMLDQTVREVRIRRAEDPAADMMTRLQARVAGRHALCDPPDFAGLASMPELRSAAVATLGAYRAWRASSDRHVGAERDRFAWQLVRDAAHDAARELGVPVGEMDAVAHVVDVEGRWAHVAGVGCGACSVATAVDLDAAAEFLHELFVSGAAP